MGQSHAQQKENNHQLPTMKSDAKKKFEFFCLGILLAILYDGNASLFVALDWKLLLHELL